MNYHTIGKFYGYHANKKEKERKKENWSEKHQEANKNTKLELLYHRLSLVYHVNEAKSEKKETGKHVQLEENLNFTVKIETNTWILSRDADKHLMELLLI